MTLFDNGIQKKIMINVQCHSVQRSIEIEDKFHGCILVGVTAKDFPDLEEGVRFISELQKKDVGVSAGLGDGSAAQWSRALELAIRTNPIHLNQIFPAASLSQHALKALGHRTLVNALIRPSGRPGYVCISTGPVSEGQENGVISVDTAAAMLSEVGVQSLKFFPIEGTKHLDELAEVARAAGKFGMAIEPTGSITPENVAAVVKTCIKAGAEHIMPHLYGSLKNRETGELEEEKLSTAYKNIKAAL